MKNLSTKLWGYLTQYKRTFIDEDDIEDYDYAPYHVFSEHKHFEHMCIKVNSPTHETNSKYELVKVDDAYKNGGIARLKTFLIASVKLYMTRIILDNKLNLNVIRLCTDGIVLNKEFDFSVNKNYSYVPIPESKTTGLIKWYHVSNYSHCCAKCGAEWKYDKIKIHKCHT